VLKVFGQFVAGIHLPKFPQVCQELLLQVHSEIAISINDQIKTISQNLRISTWFFNRI
jgi:hypothetical protein